jgi:hypothetical protein
MDFSCNTKQILEFLKLEITCSQVAPHCFDEAFSSERRGVQVKAVHTPYRGLARFYQDKVLANYTILKNAAFTNNSYDCALTK